MLIGEKIFISNGKLKGNVSPPPSKSISHRAILCAAMANGVSVLDNIVLSKDVSLTMDAVRALGASVAVEGDRIIVDGRGMFDEGDVLIDCHESGSTLRFLVPIALATYRRVRFVGSAHLGTRRLDPFFSIFQQDGISYTKNPSLQMDFEIEGSLKGGVYRIDGNVSSQFITGLLYVLPIMNVDSKIIVENGLQSRGYIDLTIDVLQTFGIEIQNNGYEEFIIKGNQKYIPQDYTVENDFSQAAFFLCADALGNDIRVDGMNMDSLQGDKQVIDCLVKLGCRVILDEGSIKVVPENLTGAVIDGSDIPDIIPILSVVCALAKGSSRLINIERLRIKECDRLSAMSDLLTRLGVEVEELENELVIHGTDHFTGGELSSYNDHRIAMSMAIASTRGTEPFVIDNPGCVNKSYIHFWDDFRKLGGKVDE